MQSARHDSREMFDVRKAREVTAVACPEIAIQTLDVLSGEGFGIPLALAIRAGKVSTC
jgi:hypothetical protein